MIGEINTKPKAGGIDIQGIINQYEVQSGGNISAGDFVEFVNSWNSVTVGGELEFNDSWSYFQNAKAILIDDNKVVVANVTSSQINARVCVINDTTITAGADTRIASSNSTSNNIQLVKLDTNKIVAIYNRSTGSYIDGIVCTISGTTINVGNSTAISSVTTTTFSVTLIDNNKILLAYDSSSSYHLLAGIVCTISGTTINVGNSTIINDVNNSGGICASVTIEKNKVFIVHKNPSNTSRALGIVCTINGTSITAGNEFDITNNTVSIPVTPILIDINKIFIISKNYIILCTINDMNVNVETSISNLLSGTGLKVDTNRILNFFKSGSNENIYIKEYSVNGTTITANNSIKIIDYYWAGHWIEKTPPILISNDRIFIVHIHRSGNYDGNGSGTVIKSNTTLLKSITTSSQKINGVAQENGTGGDTIDVIEPYTS